jgi:hypothetical protein
MTLIALGSFLIGAVLGTRFRVQVLFPAAVIGLMVIAPVAALKGEVISAAVMMAVTYATALQLGYLGGLVIRYCMVVVRSASHRSLRSNTART